MEIEFHAVVVETALASNKKSFWTEFDLFHAFFSGRFQVKEIRRKLYSMFCIGIFWEWMNFWEWFQCLYVILTFTNVLKPSEYNFNNSFVSTIASVHQSVELCTRTSKVCCWLWTPKLYFCNGSDDICHEVFEGWSWIYFENWEISSVFMQKYFLTWRLSSSFFSVNKCGSRFKTTTI